MKSNNLHQNYVVYSVFVVVIVQMYCVRYNLVLMLISGLWLFLRADSRPQTTVSQRGNPSSIVKDGVSDLRRTLH